MHVDGGSATFAVHSLANVSGVEKPTKRSGDRRENRDSATNSKGRSRI